MIARSETNMDSSAVWTQLAAPLPETAVSWRQDGQVVQRDGRFFARFVAYVDANTVRERLDGVVPGEWDLTLELLPNLGETADAETLCAFKARLQILGVIREDVGTGRDYKQAATDAFKRAAVRFGVAHELYAFEQNWVRMDGDGKYAKPIEDPAAAYVRRQTRQSRERQAPEGSPRVVRGTAGDMELRSPATPDDASGSLANTEPSCPQCGGRMWDNRLSKRNPKAPDYKCRSRGCDGVLWPLHAGGTCPGVSASAVDRGTSPVNESAA
ncbi:MAG TPA: Rad52/Rad22 family DNA repair protein [Gemmatimonadaceae bacterium]